MVEVFLARRVLAGISVFAVAVRLKEAASVAEARVLEERIFMVSGCDGCFHVGWRGSDSVSVAVMVSDRLRVGVGRKEYIVRVDRVVCLLAGCFCLLLRSRSSCSGYGVKSGILEPTFGGFQSINTHASSPPRG